MPAAVFRSFSRPYADRETHATPYVTCNLPLSFIIKNATICKQKTSLNRIKKQQL